MSKATIATTKRTNVTAATTVREVPSNEGAGPSSDVSVIVASLSDKELSALLVGIKQEQNRRRDEQQAKLPKPGDKVKLTGGDKKYVGKDGMVMNARKTRAYVQVVMPDGKYEVTYAKLTDLVSADEDNATT